MKTLQRLLDMLIAHIAWISMTTAAPLVKMLDEHPSTHRRVRMSHKFGMLAINKAGKVYLTANIQDKNTIMIIWAYGSQKHRIQGENSGMNLEMNSRGIVSAKKRISSESLFVHRVLPNRRNVFKSATYKGLFLGFNKQGLPKKGKRAGIWKNDRCYFTIFSPDALQRPSRHSIFEKFYKDSWKSG